MLDCLAGYLEQIAAFAPTWGFAFIFVFMTVESSFIPFPSEIVMIPAGFMACRGELATGSPPADLAIAFACGVAGSLAGAYANYGLSLWLGEPFLRRYGKYFFLTPEALDRAEEVFNKYGDLTTFVCRLVPVIRQLISIPAGLSRMPLGRFTFFTGLGAGIWTAVLAAAGWWLGLLARASKKDIPYRELVYKGKEMVDAWLPLILACCAALVAGYALTRRLVMRKARDRPGGGKSPAKHLPNPAGRMGAAEIQKRSPRVNRRQNT